MRDKSIYDYFPHSTKTSISYLELEVLRSNLPKLKHNPFTLENIFARIDIKTRIMGDTYIAIDRLTKSPVILKKIFPEGRYTESLMLKYINEHTSSNYFPQFYLSFEADSYDYIVEEWMPGISLSSFLYEYKNIPDNYFQGYTIIYKLLDAKRILTNIHVIHGDLLETNILWKESIVNYPL